MSSDIRGSFVEKNRNTELFPGVVGQAPDLRLAYRLARAFADLHGDARFGHRLVWVHRSSFGSMVLSTHEHAFAIAGRHTQCSVVLPEDPFVALRHLLLRSIVLPSGALALRVFDLHTSLGFGLVDGSKQTSVFAEGAVAIAVGEYALVALPTESGLLPHELPPPVIAEGQSPYRASAIPLKTSRMTLMPRPIALDAIASADGEYAIELERAGRTASLAVPSADLERGVIVGRSDKCSDTLRHITSKGTSRVHLLVLREGPHVALYDLASTQGTWAYGHRIGRAVLPDGGCTLYLGSVDPVKLTWVRRR